MAKLDAHLFICTHRRPDGACCGGRGGEQLRQAVKQTVRSRPEWRERVRVNASGCLGRCEEGIAAVLYPKGQWFLRLTPESAPELLKALSEVLKKPEP
ncbi:MAG: (2Fe-2S) ferredoxin domain-containing protein [Oligoflexia bacterium]|nr:(2Fe-2S) ferredoxin domain-containing protein [Oligoflexia bacterium]